VDPKTYFMILMEFCPEGDLKTRIETRSCDFTEEQVHSWFYQLAEAVCYIHQRDVIHRDIKTQNIFLADDLSLRLGDFGLSRDAVADGLKSKQAVTISPDQVGRTETFCFSRETTSGVTSHVGTGCYMAPEMLMSSDYGKPADLWGLGCVLLEMCSRQFLWECEEPLGERVLSEPNAVSAMVDRSDFPFGEKTRYLLKSLLHPDPTKRPTALTLLLEDRERGPPLSQLLDGGGFGTAATSQIINAGSNKLLCHVSTSTTTTSTVDDTSPSTWCASTFASECSPFQNSEEELGARIK